ncbi:hypothetical protein HDC90_004792 [Pedobacter sp. AK013]|uniref:hypothetical protein n=1 Tax=Pedobacter sp. AK013 TaxID=2723071 RepID=UPI00161CAFE2|nr:hypothetical protein [Pedobacter sp. AK013]MBB6240128.1 hypothetical protein [Pedobacter sp. AK013]
MSKKLTELADSISNDFLSEFEDDVRFTKPDIEAIILLAVVKSYEAFIKDK